MSGAIRFYFDFLSPYSYLASQLIAREPRYQALSFEHCPVVLGTIFNQLGVRGPGELRHRRRYALQDALLLAQSYGLPLAGPPKHPFNSIYALRSVLGFSDEEDRARLTARYFKAAWGDGESLEDLGVLRRCLGELGLDQDPEEAASRRELRLALKRHTEALLEAGGFGVPSFVIGDQLFFGHDRLPLLIELVAGRVAPRPAELERILARSPPLPEAAASSSPRGEGVGSTELRPLTDPLKGG